FSADVQSRVSMIRSRPFNGTNWYLPTARSHAALLCLKHLAMRGSMPSITPPATARTFPNSSAPSALLISLRPGDQAQLVRLHQIRMDRNDANTKSVGAAFRCRHRSLVEITAVAVAPASV